MSVNRKQLAAAIPGIGAKVINKDLTYALRMWKQQLKDSKTIERLHELTEFEKPSSVKRRQLLSAKYRESFRYKSE